MNTDKYTKSQIINPPVLIAKCMVSFFCLWKIKWGFRGAGFLLRHCAKFMASLHSFPLELPEGQIISLDFRDYSGMAWLLYVKSARLTEEEGLLKAIQRLSFESTVIWDVGANCGLVSYSIAKKVRFKSCHFFEPNLFVFNIAKSALNPWQCIQGHPFGLSNTDQKIALIVPDNGRSSSCATLEPEKTGRDGIKIMIETRRGDDLVATNNIPAPNIIKIDVEGHEASVLRGLKTTIQQYRPIILFEHISLTDEEVMASVPKDFRLCSIRDADGSFTRAFDRSAGHNSVLIPAEANFLRNPPAHRSPEPAASPEPAEGTKGRRVEGA